MNRQYQSGIGLVEAMVAMLLLGVAVVGFAALQVRSVDATNDAAYRVQASAIASDLAERMSIVVADSSLTTGASSNATLLAIYRDATRYTGTPTVADITACDGVAKTCSGAQLVVYDIKNAVSAAATLLPNGQVRVVQCPNAPVDCVIVSWDATTPTVGSSPSCMTAAVQYNINAACVFKEAI